MKKDKRIEKLVIIVRYSHLRNFWGRDMKLGEQWEELYGFLKDRDWHRAIKSIDGIIDSDRGNPNNYLKKGDICLKSGDKAEAVNAYLKAAWYLREGGFLRKALAVYKLVVRYDHDNDEALHESNKIMMDLETMSEAPKKAEWMIFPPEETQQETERIPPVRVEREAQVQGKAVSKSKAASGPVQHTEAPVKGETIVPLGFLSFFTAGEIEEILRRAKMEKYSDGEKVVHEGDSGDSVYIIKAGSTSIVGHFFGKAMNLETLSAGDLFGEMAFLTGRTRTADVVAKGDLEVYEINRALLEELVEKRPEILSQLTEIYIKRVKDTLKKVKSK